MCGVTSRYAQSHVEGEQNQAQGNVTTQHRQMRENHVLVLKAKTIGHAMSTNVQVQ